MIDIETIFFNQLLFKYKIVYKAIVRHNSETIDNFEPKYNRQYNLTSSVRNWQNTFQQSVLPKNLEVNMSRNETDKTVAIFLYDKPDEFNFAITNFPHRDSNILTVFAYGYIFFLFHNSYAICIQIYFGVVTIFWMLYYSIKVDFV